MKMRALLLAGTLVMAPLCARADTYEGLYKNVGQYNPLSYTFTAASTGDLQGYFVSKGNAVYDDNVGVMDNGVMLASGFGLNNQADDVGGKFDFGEVHKGDNLVFVLQNLTLGKDAYSDSSMNASYDRGKDILGHNHIYSQSYSGGIYNGVTLPALTYVAFEDMTIPKSDFNYNDDSFVFTDVATIAAVPEPSAWALMILGIGGLGLMMRRAKRSLCFKVPISV